MPNFRTGTVTALLDSANPALQKVEVDGEKAFVVVELTGRVALGDEVVINTTAVDLGLGTGGWHPVHWNYRYEPQSPTDDLGHIMKLRYTSLQTAVYAEEEGADYPDDLAGAPVVALALHSQLGPAAAAVKLTRPELRVVYVMTDGAALPLAYSDLHWALREQRIVDDSVTAGHAFGGTAEAVNVRSALAIARHRLGADVVLVGMGPGSVGTATTFGFSGLEVGTLVDAVNDAKGQAIAALRVSDSDPRPRHRGVSHHSLTALRSARHTRVVVAVPTDAPDPPDLGPLATTVRVTVPNAVEFLRAHGIEPLSMGRGPDADPAPAAYAAAAGAYAASQAAK